MSINEEELRKIVAEVVKNLEASGAAPSAPAAPAASGGPVFDTVDQAVAAANRAQPGFQDMGLEAREKIISAIREVSRANARRWAEMAVAETGMGRVADKVLKNLVCADKTPGVEDLRAVAYTGDKGLALVEYAPFGVVA
ncbi:MAG TPA: aldehyde dehydrogenase family protein, partial [Elusimicrobiales bacterium]|nr:aldehyde dehydrogenase family protein [Elusimicrobiales bacterium]